MKKFKFKLQSLLNVKLSVEKQLKGELAGASARVVRFEAELEELLKRIEGERFRYRMQIDKGMSPGEMALFDIGFRAFREHVTRQEKKIEVAQDEKARIQRKLTEAIAERKMVEKLKEKAYEEYLEEVRREDAKAIDEFLSSRVAAQMRE